MATCLLLIVFVGVKVNAGPGPNDPGVVILAVWLVQLLALHRLMTYGCRDFDDLLPQAWPLAEVAGGLLFFTSLTLAAMGCCGVVWLLRHPLGRVRQKFEMAAAARCIRRRPGDYAGYHTLARLLIDEGRSRQAAEVLHRWLRHHPDDHAVRRQMELLRSQGQAADSRAISDLLPVP